MKCLSSVVIALGAWLFAFCPSAEPQQPTRIARIGYLSAVPLLTDANRLEALRQSLAELGYIEGKNMFIEWRTAAGKLDQLPALAAELVQLKVDVIVTAGATDTRAAKQATVTIPIVMVQDPDPVGNGFVASLARPGGNITGLSSLTADLSGKRLELLKEALPKVSRAAVFGSSTNAANAQQLKELKRVAAALKIQLQELDVLSSKDLEASFRAAAKANADAVLLLRGPVFNSHRRQVVDLAAKSRLPATYPQIEFVEAGGLMSYGVSQNDLSRRAATYVDKILKGAKPGDLPVEQPTKFELAINLKTASQIGITIPPNVLARADRVIR